MTVTVRLDDCRTALARMPDACMDSIVTDPPYELAFMGRAWDGSGVAYDVTMWAECLRVLKPGGHLLAFGGTRTYHRMACAVEDAGFEIRDSITWLYASGFPKSLDVGKAIDKAAGAVREVVGRYAPPNGSEWNLERDIVPPGEGGTMGAFGVRSAGMDVTAPATPAAAQWKGWGTALKPASEPIVVARKPFPGTVAANVQEWGTGALNVDGCRVGTPESKRAAGTRTYQRYDPGSPGKGVQPAPHDRLGRWPANVALSHASTPDGEDACTDGCVPGCPVAELDGQSGIRPGAVSNGSKTVDGLAGTSTFKIHAREQRPGRADTGGASRFFPTFRYQAKAPARERPKVDGVSHPTVKPLALMQWLVRLVTPPGGTVLDPFAGSGTTVEAAIREGFAAYAIESDPASLPLIAHRIQRCGLLCAAVTWETPAE